MSQGHSVSANAQFSTIPDAMFDGNYDCAAEGFGFRVSCPELLVIDDIEHQPFWTE
jgi:hypothetical protein